MISKKDQEYLNKVGLLVATPCYGGVVNAKYTENIVSLSLKALGYNMSFGYYTRVNESLITRARNDLVFSFLQTPATHLMFIDADINFNPDDIFKMLLADKDVITGAYPAKAIDWEKMSKAGDMTVEGLQHNGTIFASSIKENKKTFDGLIEVEYGATGFMLIKREVLENMIKYYPETKYIPEIYDDIKYKGLPKYALFDTMIYEDKYLSEDYTFCHRWQQMGGKIYVDPQIVLDHVGTYTFKGSSIS